MQAPTKLTVQKINLTLIQLMNIGLHGALLFGTLRRRRLKQTDCISRLFVKNTLTMLMGAISQNLKG